MTNLLSGYDMAIAISQNEINSQFQRLFGQTIATTIRANGLSKGTPFGGGSLQLSTYIRGPINAPQVLLAPGNNPLDVDFYFSFVSKPVLPKDFNLQDTDFADAFSKSPDGINALLCILEDIPYTGVNGEHLQLSKQPVYYWLRRTPVTAGNVISYRYSQIPAIYYKENGLPMMIMLTGLQVSFKVMISHLPTTPEAIREAVKEGLLLEDVLKIITESKYNEEAFSLNQLFLNFDNTNFSQWNLLDPVGSLGNQVTGLGINTDGSYAVATLSVSELANNDPDFASAFSTNLQYTFAQGGKNTAGKTPFIIALTGNSTDPAKTDIDLPPSLVATYIGYSCTPNAKDPGLAAFNYQVLCGDKPETRIPKNNDSTIINITTDFIENNNFSGTLLFSENAFFKPFVLERLINALDTRAPWIQPNTSTFTSNYRNKNKIYDAKSVHLGAGIHKYVTQEDNNTYSIQVIKNQIYLSGTFARTITLDLWTVLADHDTVQFTWKKTGQLNWSDSITLITDAQSQLIFKSQPIFQPIQIGPTQKDYGADIYDHIVNALESLGVTFFPLLAADLHSALANGLQNEGKFLNNSLLEGTRNNFISPTGKKFLFNNPRFNEELDLKMDITYSI
jgi:hypothetical protein